MFETLRRAAAFGTKLTAMDDLIVVGGGPAGLATSIFAAMAGMRVRLLERRRLPLDKPCGEGLMPSGVDALAQMGLSLRSFRDIRGIRYLDGSRAAEAAFRRRNGLGIRRLELSRALTARARDLGVEIRERTGAASIRDHGDSVSVRERCGGELRARWLVGADGLHSEVRKAVGLDVAIRTRAPRRYGVRRHYAVRPWTSFVEVYWADGGEAYVTPVAEDEIGVALLWHDPPTSYKEGLSRFPTLAERLEGAEVTTSARGAGAFRQETSSVRAR